MRKRWNPELVIEAIKRRAMSGQSLGYSATVADDESLTGAARRYFGSWDAAVTAAGYDINEYKYKLRDERVERWDREKVLREVREYAQSGGNLSAGYVRSHKSKLYSAAVTYCGSWRQALEANGINYDEVKLRDEWSPDRVIETIQKAHKEGADLSDQTINALRHDLYGAAYTHFGSWRAAVEASGILPDEVRRTRAWDRERIIEFVNRCFKAGITLNQMVEAGLIHKNNILDHFTTVKDFYQVAGIETTPDSTQVQSRLDQILREKNISPAALAEKIGCTETYIRHLMRAKYPPRLPNALRIAKVLECDVGDIWSID
jgi:DNA-binding Xre family transcriptional regulator